MVAGLLIVVAVWVVVRSRHTYNAPPEAKLGVKNSEGKSVGTYWIPSDSQIASLPNGKEIPCGKRLLNETTRLLPSHVGDGLNRSSCHLAQCMLAKPHPTSTPTKHTRPSIHDPAVWSHSNSASTDVSSGRCTGNRCPPVPRNARDESLYAVVGQNVPPGDKVDVVNAGKVNTGLVPDPIRGKLIYGEPCASCHGVSGEGMKDQAGEYIFPPLWGDNSYNIAAGMARTYKAAAFTEYNMPLTRSHDKPLGQGGVLTDQDALDVAEYFTHQPRPDFPGKVNDWKNQKKPKDARY